MVSLYQPPVLGNDLKNQVLKVLDGVDKNFKQIYAAIQQPKPGTNVRTPNIPPSEVQAVVLGLERDGEIKLMMQTDKYRLP